ncbi:diaminohydroxyphosphoribosylamino-pyrimidine deaminase [Suillus clintonianus]|uniref:diaminohydroxyphosphoribosylamino-pyrimidine deaminase n=1 Tax=Suillus clintonianus TaxID=1904413 RepID=UPI001B875CF8|nr:diaminohydroxyphosphoribosylamino-pyrimidine deaminase [Suillus clintonianus]KAG2157194.1 diaminohydroxyphosphoribosylamino-pyrimidine deaminase [Suillus clintonianus]
MTPTSKPQTSDEHEHDSFVRQALEQAALCEPVPTAFCVGCVLVARLLNSEPIVLSKGFSRELPGNTHAEANALAKVESLSSTQLQSLVSPWPWEAVPAIEDLLRLVDVYTTLEPCSVRTSGLAACADALIRARIKRCIIGVREPDDFVKCEGAQKMKDAGIEVIWYGGLEQECLDAARRGRPI